MIDEHSRLCLAIRVDRRCKAKDVVAVLEELTSVYPAPTFIRSDNGPEFNCFAEDARIDVKALRRSICRWRSVGAAGPRAAIGTRPLLASEQAPIAWGLGTALLIGHLMRCQGIEARAIGGPETTPTP